MTPRMSPPPPRDTISHMAHLGSADREESHSRLRQLYGEGVGALRKGQVTVKSHLSVGSIDLHRDRRRRGKGEQRLALAAEGVGIGFGQG